MRPAFDSIAEQFSQLSFEMELEGFFNQYKSEGFRFFLAYTDERAQEYRFGTVSRHLSDDIAAAEELSYMDGVRFLVIMDMTKSYVMQRLEFQGSPDDFRPEYLIGRPFISLPDSVRDHPDLGEIIQACQRPQGIMGVIDGGEQDLGHRSSGRLKKKPFPVYDGDLSNPV